MFWISSRSAAARSKSSSLAAARISVSIRATSFSIAFGVLEGQRPAGELLALRRVDDGRSATDRSRSLMSWISLTIVVGSIPCSVL